MRLSKMHFKTLREVPSEAEIPSHILMLRAGIIRKLVSGVYGFMPLGWRAVRKIEGIIREEMDAAGISMGQLRFSIGLENAEDIIAEFEKALESVK